ncbi:4-hydroxyproline epimerase [Eudoraea sp.]|uniref:4-hydroxyproline epimerase n=3 Tax=Eudoraea sp. TaxID=1979955 RepID=UPI003C752D8C
MPTSTFSCIDAHTCGNPVRLITKGFPELKGRDMSEKRQHFLREFDWIRKGLMFEPRGHDMMSGGFFLEPSDPSNDLGILFMETSGCLPMCGHGTIGAITIGLEEGLINPKIPGSIRLETPAGLVKVSYELNKGKVDWVKFDNIKSYLAESNLTAKSDTLGELDFDVAYGGNFYAIIDSQKNFKGLEEFTASELIFLSRQLRQEINKKYPNRFIHPENKTIKDVTHILWTGKPLNEHSTARNAVFYGDKAIDRSPCGTGTSARMAQWHAKGLLKPEEDFIHESYIGSKFIGRIESLSTIKGIPAIIPSIQGWARIYGHNTITIDKEDPFALGFQVI